jgi:hypothetical protein
MQVGANADWSTAELTSLLLIFQPCLLNLELVLQKGSSRAQFCGVLLLRSICHRGHQTASTTSSCKVF